MFRASAVVGCCATVEMNFLKKKIKTVKTVVHGKRKDDDDDDFDNYVPEVPPHPSTLADNGTPSTSSLFPVNFPAHFQSTLDSLGSVADSTVKSLVGLGLSDAQTPEEEAKENLSLDQLKEREQEHKKAEKDKIKQQEESKKDNEEWKYFLSLTAKVEAVTSKTQSALTKLKDESAVDEISALEDPCFLDRYDQSAPKVAGGWIAFEEQEQVNPADPILKQPTGKCTRPTSYEPPFYKDAFSFLEAAAPPVQPQDESTQKLARELIDDFGFTNPAPGIPAPPLENLSLADLDIDPFDTSFIDIEAIKSGKSVKPTELIQDLDLTQVEFDPFDTSHIATPTIIDKTEVVPEETEVDVKVGQEE